MVALLLQRLTTARYGRSFKYLSKNYMPDRNCRKLSADHGKYLYDCLRFVKNYFVAVIKKS